MPHFDFSSGAAVEEFHVSNMCIHLENTSYIMSIFKIGDYSMLHCWNYAIIKVQIIKKQNSSFFGVDVRITMYKPFIMSLLYIH